MVDSPSCGALTKAPRWDLADTEGYGGGNCFLLAPWMFSGYVGIYRRKKYVGGATRGPRGWKARLGVSAPPTSWPPCWLLDIGSKSPGSCSVRKSCPRRFHSVWTPFDIPVLRNPKIGKNSNSGLGLLLIG